MSSPETTIVIPTYNRKESLVRTLRGLERQSVSVERYEVVVVSDGSTDGTIKHLDSLPFTFRLRVLEQPNSGPSAARNYGARAACGDLIVYLDDDVEPVAKFIEAHLNAHASDQKLVVIGPQSTPPGERFPVWVAWEHRMLEKQYVRFKSGEWQAGPNNLYSGNFSIRKEHLIAVGGFDIGFVRQEDVELGFRLEKHGLYFRFVAEADGWHRPTRTWQSWYTTPHTYGIRDVQMARDKGVDQAMALARKHYAERNAVTRSIAKICVGGKLREAFTFGALVPMIHLSDRICLRAVSLALCSLVFNLRYFQGMSQEMGGARQMWNAIATKAGS